MNFLDYSAGVCFKNDSLTENNNPHLCSSKRGYYAENSFSTTSRAFCRTRSEIHKDEPVKALSRFKVSSRFAICQIGRAHV